MKSSAQDMAPNFASKLGGHYQHLRMDP